MKLTDPERTKEDAASEITLRPTTLDEFVGQSKIKKLLRVFLKAAKQRKEAVDHILFSGPPGLGKTTLASIVAHEMSADMKTSSGPAIERQADMAGILTSLGSGDILFIDEIHRIPKTVEELLYSAMEDFKVDIVIGEGPGARNIRLALERFTLIGATTRQGLLSEPMRARFGISFRLDYYDQEEIAGVIQRSARIMRVDITQDGIRELARRSRGTPRVANRLLRRLRDFAQVEGQGIIDGEIARYGLDMMDVDERGLDEMDKRILLTIIQRYKGGPVGIKNLSVALGEDPGTIEEVYEPFLIREGLLQRTPRGRVATALAYEHLSLI